MAKTAMATALERFEPAAAGPGRTSAGVPRLGREGIATGAWRLAPAALAAAALTRFAPWSLALLGVAGAALAYALLVPHGSAHAQRSVDPWSAPSRGFGWAGFLAGCASLGAFAILATAPILAAAAPAHRLTAAALLASSAAVALAIAMGAQGWRWGHALTLGGVGLLALAAVAAFSVEPLPAADWATGFVRLAFVFLLAEALAPGRGAKPDALGALHAVLAWLMLALAQRLPEDVGPGAMLEPWAWQAVMAALAAYLGTRLWAARQALGDDLRWAFGERHARPMAPGLAAAAGFFPAAALAPLAGWSLWATAFALGVCAAVAGRAAWRGDASR